MSPRFRAGRCRVSIRSTPSNSFAPARHARRVEGSNSASGKERQVEEVGELIGLYDKKTGKEFIGEYHWLGQSEKTKSLSPADDSLFTPPRNRYRTDCRQRLGQVVLTSCAAPRLLPGGPEGDVGSASGTWRRVVSNTPTDPRVANFLQPVTGSLSSTRWIKHRTLCLP